MILQPQLRQLLDLPNTFKRADLTFYQLMQSVAAALTLGTDSNSALLTQANYAQVTAGWNDVWGALAGIARRFEESNGTYHNRIPNMILAARDSPVAIELWLELIENVVGTVTQRLPDWGYTVNLPATLTPQQVQQVVKDLAYVRPAGMPFNAAVSTGGTYLDTVNYFGPSKFGYVLGTGDGSVIGAVDDTGFTTVDGAWNYGGRVTGSWFGAGSGTFMNTTNYYGARKYPQRRNIRGVPIPIGVTGIFPWNFGGRVTGAWFASKQQVSGADIPSATNNQLSNLPDILLTDPTINPPV